MVGKLLGTFLFWFVTISISYIIIYFISGSWYIESYLQIILFLFYVVSLVLFIATIITKSKLTMFLGTILGIVLPMVGLFVITINKWYLRPFQYVLPYKYLNEQLSNMLIPLLISVGYILMDINVM